MTNSAVTELVAEMMGCLGFGAYQIIRNPSLFRELVGMTGLDRQTVGEALRSLEDQGR